MHSKHNSTRPSWLLMAVLAGAVSPVATAQVSPVPQAEQAGEKAPEEQTEQSLVATPAPPRDNGRVEQVTVTAQKRAQRLSDVPVAVTAVSAAQLARQGIVSADQLQYAVPELTHVNGPVASYSVRGIGTTGFSRSAESTVAVVIDGVVQGQIVQSTSALFDIERVEVLSGPQGMLFGKNASAGLINIVTNAPDPKALSFDGHVEAGTKGQRVYQGTLNVPVAENAAVRASAFTNKGGNYLTDVVNNKGYGGFKDQGGRLRFLWKPNSDLTVNLNGDYEDNRGGTVAWTMRQATGPVAAMQASCGVTANAENTEFCSGGEFYREQKSYGASMQLDYRIGDHTLTSVTAKRRFSNVAQADSDTFVLDLLDLNTTAHDSEQFSQELRLTSAANKKLEYVAGLYFYDYTLDHLVDQAGTFGVPPFIAGNIKVSRAAKGTIDQQSAAVFAQGTWYATPKLGFILGARYTRDKLRSELTTFVNSAAGINFPPITGALATSDESVRTNNLSYRTGAQYKLGPDGLAYATYSRGYKGAALNNHNTPGADTVVRPEIPKVFEIGLKNSWLDRRLVTDISVYHQDFADFQGQLIKDFNGERRFIFANASHLYVKGIQANFTARPVPALRINGGLSFNDATYGDFIVPCSASNVTAECVASGGSLNAKGRQLALSPKWKFVLSASYNRPINESLDGFVHLDASYRTAVDLGNPDPRLVNPAYTMLNGRVGVSSSDGKYTLSLFGKNLTDKRFASLVFNDPVSAANGTVQSFTLNSFRTVGLALDIRL